MICPKAAELIICVALPSTASVHLRLVKAYRAVLVEQIECKVASTIITAPSTIKPKSIAPKLIRFAATPKTFIIANANK